MKKQTRNGNNDRSKNGKSQRQNRAQKKEPTASQIADELEEYAKQLLVAADILRGKP